MSLQIVMIWQDSGQEKPRKHHMLRTLMEMGGGKSFLQDVLEVLIVAVIQIVSFLANLL